MRATVETYRSDQLLLILFSIFVAAATFSIALAQIALGLSFIVFLYQNVTGRYLLIYQQTRLIFLLIVAFIAWQIITSIAAAGIIDGLKAVENLALFLALPIGLQVMRSEKNLRQLLHVLALFTLIGSVAGIIQFFSGVEWPGVRAPRVNEFFGFRAQGLFSSPMTFAHCFVIPVVLFLTLGLNQLKNKKEMISSRICLIVGGIGAIAILLAFSRGAIVGLIVALIWTAYQLKTKAIIYILVTMIIITGLSTVLLPDMNRRFQGLFDIDLNSQMYTGRLHIWQKSAEIITDTPILGVGRSNFKAEYVARMNREVPKERLPGDAHNDWLNIMTVAGIPGALLLLALWYSVIRGIRRAKYNPQTAEPLASAALATIVAILTMGLFASLFEDAEVIHLIMLTWLFGLASAQLKLQREAN